MWTAPTPDELREADCLFASDAQGGRELAPFRRAARLHQARWREEHGWPIGDVRGTPVGNRLGPGTPTGVNFLSDAIREAVAHRLAHPENLQTLDASRLNDNLLSSMPLCFNLFGELRETDVAPAGALLGHPHPGPLEVRFEHSPGRRDPAYTNDRTAFDVALLLGERSAPRSVVGIETKYHEHPLRESEDVVRERHREIAVRSGAFRDGWREAIEGTTLQQVWRDHLLLLSMLEYEEWSDGCYVLVHPEANTAFAEVGRRYGELLARPETFRVVTIEQLLEVPGLMSEETHSIFVRRYLLGPMRN